MALLCKGFPLGGSCRVATDEGRTEQSFVERRGSDPRFAQQKAIDALHLLPPAVIHSRAAAALPKKGAPRRCAKFYTNRDVLRQQTSREAFDGGVKKQKHY